MLQNTRKIILVVIAQDQANQASINVESSGLYFLLSYQKANKFIIRVEVKGIDCLNMG